MVDLFLERFHNFLAKLRSLHFAFEILKHRDNPFRVHHGKVPLQITAIHILIIQIPKFAHFPWEPLDVGVLEIYHFEFCAMTDFDWDVLNWIIIYDKFLSNCQ
jgi:hypothetical protein